MNRMCSGVDPARPSPEEDIVGQAPKQWLPHRVGSKQIPTVSGDLGRQTSNDELTHSPGELPQAPAGGEVREDSDAESVQSQQFRVADAETRKRTVERKFSISALKNIGHRGQRNPAATASTSDTSGPTVSSLSKRDAQHPTESCTDALNAQHRRRNTANASAAPRHSSRKLWRTPEKERLQSAIQSTAELRNGKISMHWDDAFVEYFANSAEELPFRTSQAMAAKWTAMQRKSPERWKIDTTQLKPHDTHGRERWTAIELENLALAWRSNKNAASAISQFMRTSTRSRGSVRAQLLRLTIGTSASAKGSTDASEQDVPSTSTDTDTDLQVQPVQGENANDESAAFADAINGSLLEQVTPASEPVPDLGSEPTPVEDFTPNEGTRHERAISPAEFGVMPTADSAVDSGVTVNEAEPDSDALNVFETAVGGDQPAVRSSAQRVDRRIRDRVRSSTSGAPNRELPAASLPEDLLESFRALMRRRGKRSALPLPDACPSQETVDLVDRLLATAQPFDNYEKLSKGLYCAVKAVLESLPKSERRCRITEQGEFISHLCQTITGIRRSIGRLTALERYRNGEIGCNTSIRRIIKWYQVSRDEESGEVRTRTSRWLARKREFLVRNLHAQQERLAKARQALDRMVTRADYTSVKKQSCRKPENKGKLRIEHAYQCYSNILGTGAAIDEAADLFTCWKAGLPDVEPIAEQAIDQQIWKRTLAKAKSWKAPGPDGIHTFWWKRSVVARTELLDFCQSWLHGGQMPRCLTLGRTVLIYKNKGSETEARNYRPITCLNTSYKLLTKAVTMMVDAHVRSTRQWNPMQRALTTGWRSCAHAHMTDRAIQLRCRKAGQPLCVAWFDYEKAFDTTPHDLMHFVLKSLGVAENIRLWLRHSMTQWRIRIELPDPRGVGLVQSGPIEYKRGIFQGDSLSPLLFCLTMLPLQAALDRWTDGVQIGIKHDAPLKVTHQLYVDDLKIYAIGAAKLKGAIENVLDWSKSMNMSVGLAKCAQAHTVNPKGIVESTIPLLKDGETYKYLGVLQGIDSRDDKVWAETYERVLKIAKDIFGRPFTWSQMVRRFNAEIPPVIRFLVSCGVQFDAEKGLRLDCAIRRIMRKCGVRTRSALVSRVYLCSSMGGLSLKNMENVIEEAQIARTLYLEYGPRDIRLIGKILRSRQVAANSLWMSGDSLARRILPTYREGFWKLKQVSQLMLRQHKRDAQTFFLKEVRKHPYAARLWGKSLKWCLRSIGRMLKVGDLEPYAARLVISAHERQLRVVTHPGNKVKSNSCAWCGDHVFNATAELKHVLGTCEKYRKWHYDRHENVASWVHHYLVKNLVDPSRVSPKFGRPPDDVISGKGYTIWYDQTVPGMPRGAHCKPDLLVFDEEEQLAYIIEIGIAADDLLRKRQQAKFDRYELGFSAGEARLDCHTSLARHLESASGEGESRSAIVIPFVVGYLGEQLPRKWCKNHKMLENLVGGPREFKEMCVKASTTSAYTSSRILRKYLGRVNLVGVKRAAACALSAQQ